jgi:ABC-type bacteriocin/lantibiotic exporter with double-glycine peptidase domain
VLIAVLDIAAVAILLFIINFYTHPETVTPSFVPKYFFNRNSVLPVAFFLIFFCIKNFTGYFFSQVQYQLVYRVASRLSKKNLLQYLEGSYTNYVTTDSSINIKKISQYPIEFGHYVLWGLQQIIAQFILISVTIMVMLIFNAKLFLLLFIILFPPVVIIVYIGKVKTRMARIHIKASGEQALQYLKEAISGFIESNIYNCNEFFTERYIAKQIKLNQYLASLQAVQGMPARLIEVFAVFGFFVLLALSKWTDNAVTPSILTIGTFMAAAYKIIPGIVKILNSSGMIKTYEYTIGNLPENNPTTRPQQNTTPSTAIKSIEYKNISFNYAGKNILTRFDCELKQGDFAGITGASGKGKTTIINLLLGFENNASGEIFINEQAGDGLSRSQFWKNIAYVKQQPFIIHDSIANNITLGEKEINEQRLTGAIIVSGLQEVLDHYHEGLNKIVTENGKNLSGGQRQRILIARALYKNADLIILDEPFNELDKTSENKLLAHFKELARSGKIVILITHSKESFSFCNKIISLDEN